MEWIALYLLGVGAAKGAQDTFGPNMKERYLGFFDRLFGVSDTNPQSV